MAAWLSSTKNRVILIVAAILFVVAAVAVAVGVARHREGGLLRVCWDDEGRARYTEDGIEGNEAESCEGAEELVWPASQIPIIVAPTLDESDLLPEGDRRSKVFDQAIHDFNGQVGVPLLRRVSEGVRASAWVHFGQGIEARNSTEVRPAAPPGYAFHYHDGERLAGDIYVRSDVESSDRLLFRVLLHEFGHLAGLAHDDFTASIMFPLTRDDMLDDQMSTAHITDHDVRLLRRYRSR